MQPTEAFKYFQEGKVMEVSFDGMRKNATDSMNSLCEVIKEVIALKSYDEVDEDLKNRLIEAFNDSAMRVDFFNCLYDDSVDGDMNNLSDLCVDRLDDLEEEE